MNLLFFRYGIEGLASCQVQYSSAMIHSGLRQIATMLDRYYPGATLLKGRWIKYGDFNGLDQSGRILFHINDVPSEWQWVKMVLISIFLDNFLVKGGTENQFKTTFFVIMQR